MIWRALIVVAGLFIASVAGAEPAALAAVGLLDLRGKAACTGTLIAPDLVLTAGHCLKASEGERSFTAEDIAFRPGRSPGQPRPASKSWPAHSPWPPW